MGYKFFVGFCPWPRVWATEKAEKLARQVKLRSNIFLDEPLNHEQNSVFKETANVYHSSNFEVRLCADGIILYRHNDYELKIKDDCERYKKDIECGGDGMTTSFQGSSESWGHYIPALNILFALIESELHCQGRNYNIYWAQPIGRTDVVRVKYSADNLAESFNAYGPITEMLQQRLSGGHEVGARMHGEYNPSVIAAFKDACIIFEKAHNDKELWLFLERYANAWTMYKTELFNASLLLSWTLIEKDLFCKLKTFLNRFPKKKLYIENQTGRNKLYGKDKDLRAKIINNESPMAGTIIGILNAHSQPIHQNLVPVKNARDALLHKGATVTSHQCREALKLCSSIAKNAYSIEINCSLDPNPHLAMTS